MTDHIMHLNDENFENQVADGVTLVDFYADWCGPCKMMVPILEELATELQGQATVAKVDIETAQKVTSDFNVTSVPTMVLIKNGEELQRIVGVRDKDSLHQVISSAV